MHQVLCCITRGRLYRPLSSLNNTLSRLSLASSSCSSSNNSPTTVADLLDNNLVVVVVVVAAAAAGVVFGCCVMVNVVIGSVSGIVLGRHKYVDKGESMGTIPCLSWRKSRLKMTYQMVISEVAD